MVRWSVSGWSWYGAYNSVKSFACKQLKVKSFTCRSFHERVTPRGDWIHSGVCCVARDRFLNVVEHLLPQNNAQPEFGSWRWCFYHYPSKHAAGKHECILGFTPAPDTFDLSIPCPFDWFGVGSVFGSTVVERGYQQYSLEIYCFIRNTQEKQILENTTESQTGPQWKREDKYITREILGIFTTARIRRTQLPEDRGSLRKEQNHGIWNLVPFFVRSSS